MKILVLNSGSSSQKSCLYEIGNELPNDPPPCLWEGKIEWSGEQAEFSIRNSRGASHQETIPAGSRDQAIECLLESLWSGETRAISCPSEIDVVGHRVVHGGPRYFEPAFVDADVKSAIEGASAFAPLHNRAELQGMETVEKLLRKDKNSVRQVAVFDTGFHHNMPLAASTYPGPYEWFAEGIRRYGFHGINHEYCSLRAARLLGNDVGSSQLKLVTCHLGNGCSLAAIRDGRSVDTTMGFTPLEGLMMGTRSGSVDPGILTYLMRQKKLSGQQLEEILNKKSGLLGISGISGDMREIVAAMSDRRDFAQLHSDKENSDKQERAKLAFEIYVHRVQSGIGAMIGVLGGVDALVFTAGVGENSAEVRGAVCDNFAFMGVRIDPLKNKKPDADSDISADGAAVRVLVIRAQEDWMIARKCWKLMATN